MPSTVDSEVRDPPIDFSLLSHEGSELSWKAKPSLIEKYPLKVDQHELALSPNHCTMVMCDDCMRELQVFGLHPDRHILSYSLVF